MGLDIADNTHAVSERVGSYSGTHSLRARYIELAIAYLQSEKKKVQDKLRLEEEKTKDKDNSSSKRKAETSESACPNSKSAKTDGDEEEDCEEECHGSGDDEEECLEGTVESIDRLIKTLTSWVEFPQNNMDIFATSVNYRAISGDVSDSMHQWNMTGLLHFVNCSDCEEVWSYGQCLDIHEFFQVVIPFKKATHDSTTEDVFALEHMEILDGVFEYAVKNNGWVIRC